MPNNPPPGSEKTAAPVPSMEPGFVRLPDPASLFRTRAVRLSELAIGHRLAPYLTFLAALARIQENLAASALPPAALAPEGAPLNRSRFVPAEPERALADAFLAALAGVAMPEPAAAALRRVRQSDAASRTAALKQALATPAPTEALPEHALLCAALQIAFSRRAAGLAPETLSPGPAGSCPICASPPLASLLVRWPGARGARYCGCGLCGCFWLHPRITCTLCGATQGIEYHGIDGDAGTIKAESCSSCRRYVKILHQFKDPAMEPLADDIASLGLDLLMQETGFARGAVNPFLLGY